MTGSHDPEPLAMLRELARAAGVEIRDVRARATPEGDPPARSGACRLGDRVWVVLVAGDSVEDRIAALADALDRAEPGWRDAHWLPPAVRERLERGRGAS
jgi:hypothetical protein